MALSPYCSLTLPDLPDPAAMEEPQAPTIFRAPQPPLPIVLGKYNPTKAIAWLKERFPQEGE